MEMLRLQSVFKIYKTGSVEAVALRGANLSVEAGASLAIIGRSGSGKSTLLHLAGGLGVPSAGKVFVSDTLLSDMDERARADYRRRNIGIVYQADNLIPFLTAQENVELPIRLVGGKRPAARARELLSQLGLGMRLHHKGAFLSGGERQRVAIAMGLANEPRLLLADEPTGELDSRTADEVMSALTQLCTDRGNTLILVTHNPEIARRARQQVLLVDGSFKEAEHV